MSNLQYCCRTVNVVDLMPLIIQKQISHIFNKEKNKDLQRSQTFERRNEKMKNKRGI